MSLIYYILYNFILYSFCGWIIEELYCLFINKRFKKDGFLIGPVKPMYGIAMVALIFLYYVLNIRGISMIILCLIIPSIVEYMSGYLLKRIINKTYWDYKDIRFNVDGYICLRFSLYWMVLSYIGILFLQPTLNRIYLMINGSFFEIALILLTLLYAFDFIQTIKEKYYRFINIR